MSKFQPGVSGNLQGRPRGSRNRVTGTRGVFADMLAKDGAEIMRVAIDQAKGGEPSLIIALLARMVPPLKAVTLPSAVPLDPSKSDAENRSLLIAAMADGRLSIDDGTALMGALKLGSAAGGLLSITLNLDSPPRSAVLPSVVIENETARDL